MIFYIGLHIVAHAYEFEYCMLSINNPKLRDRKSDIKARNWIMDSGAFRELELYGHYRYSVNDYAERIKRWATCGILEMAVSQDYMCEPYILGKTGLTIKDHQRLTIERYDGLCQLTQVPIMPVLQGYEIEDYRRHLTQYGWRLRPNMRVGIGSVCKRNTDIKQIENIVWALAKERPDLRYHGFGLKKTALSSDIVRSLLYSADSMAWSMNARKNKRDGNSPLEARKYITELENAPIQGNLLVREITQQRVEGVTPWGVK